MRAHSSNTDETNAAPAALAAISPAAAHVSVETAALQQNAQNLPHIPAKMLLLTVLGTPPAARASRITSQRGECSPVSSPKDVTSGVSGSRSRHPASIPH